MRQWALSVAALCVLAIGGCAQRAAHRDVPALLTNPTAASRAELVRVVGEAMNGAPVAIADDALTAEDVLIVERAPRRDDKGIRLEGRETARPEHFRLVKYGSQCVLVHVETSRRWVLASATCSPR